MATWLKVHMSLPNQPFMCILICFLCTNPINLHPADAAPRYPAKAQAPDLASCLPPNIRPGRGGRRAAFKTKIVYVSFGFRLGRPLLVYRCLQCLQLDAYWHKRYTAFE